jgi:hypothetical protein
LFVYLAEQFYRQVENAKATEQKIDEELKDLQATLANIENVRPFDELTVSDPLVLLWDSTAQCPLCR